MHIVIPRQQLAWRKGANMSLSDQFSLFADAAVCPEGLSYVPNFISSAVEHELIGHVAALPLQPFQFGQYEGNRRVASFGWRYDYAHRRLLAAEPIPDWIAPLIERVEVFGGAATRIDQVLCTEYEAGVGIGWHRDKPHFDRIFGVSLGSTCRLRFRRRSGDGWERRSLEVEPKSVYLMSGPSRLEWEHSIPAVDALRYSLTFRTLKASAGGSPQSPQDETH